MRSLLYLLFLISASLSAQSNYQMGLDLAEDSYDQLPQTSARVESGIKALVNRTDLSGYCPEVRHQGEVSSCVGWSAGYAAMTIERAIKNGWTDPQLISEQANSALFIFNQISKGNCQRAISLGAALRLLEAKGNCLARDFDFNPDDCSGEISSELAEKAAQYKIASFQALFRSSAEPETKIQNVKILLAQQKPVIVGMKVLQNFYQIKSGDQSWWPNIGNTQYAGAHAMVVVGYDDQKFNRTNKHLSPNMQGAFKVMNSWGKNWGEQGFIWIRYAHFAKYCRQAFAITIAEGSPIDLSYQSPVSLTTAVQTTSKPETAKQNSAASKLVRLSGSFGFRHYKGWDQGHIFEEAPVQLLGDHYRLVGDWQLGERFQLQVKSGFNQGYIYVLSVDATGKAEVHFPQSRKYNIKVEGMDESPLLLSSGSTLSIPAADKALQLTRPGKDHLVVLFATKKIKPKYIKLLCNALSSNKVTLLEELHRVLGEHMVPTADIRYFSEEMRFEVSSRSRGKIVPLVLEVEVMNK